MKRAATIAIATLVASTIAGCPSNKPDAGVSSASIAASASPASSTAATQAPAAHAERGPELLAKFECNRCHEGTGLAKATQDKACFGCHADILRGDFKAPEKDLAYWRTRVAYVRVAPSLTSAGRRFTEAWIQGYLLHPSDLRPNLAATMPRLAIGEDDARDLAAYLAKDAPAPTDELEGADLARGRAAIEAKQCGECHVFSGVAPISASNATKGGFTSPPAIQLAPDLRFARERLRPGTVVAWIRHPTAMKADTLMPETAMTDAEARDMAAYILRAPLEPIMKAPIPARLPVLARKVGYDEVAKAVLRKTCWHCHAEPDYAIGDGGPGNTGGLGFKPRGLNVAEYAGVRSGELDDEGNRRSVLTPTSDGTPRLLRALLARQKEESGAIDPDIRGMPLGYPSLTPEEIQLVETWVAQGAPR